MPAKAPIDENVKFLFACLIRSDYKTIDFTRVAADFSINPAAARMRWSRLKKTINVDDIASSILDGKKRRMSKAGPPPPSSFKVEEKFEDGASQLPPPTSSSSSSSAAAAAGIILKEEEEKEGEVALQEESAPLLFAGLPKPPKFKRPGAEEQVSIPVVDEATGTTGRFPVTHVPHLPRVAEAAAVEAPETKSQLTAPQKHLLASAVQVPSTVKSEPEPHLEEEEEEGKPMKSEPPPTDTIRKNACSAIAAVLTAKGSKKRKVEST